MHVCACLLICLSIWIWVCLREEAVISICTFPTLYILSLVSASTCALLTFGSGLIDPLWKWVKFRLSLNPGWRQPWDWCFQCENWSIVFQLFLSCVQECLSGGLFAVEHRACLLSTLGPCWTLLHSAGVNSNCVLALLAADRAAPRKLAGAALYHLSSACSVPRPTTHQLAAIRCQSRGTWGMFDK